MKNLFFLTTSLITLGILGALVLKFPPYPIPYFNNQQNEQITHEEILD